MKIKEEIMNLKDELIALRRDFHMHPELGYQEIRTSEIVGNYLDNLGLEVKRGIGRTGVVGLLEGKEKGKVVMLRTEMDALPVQELNDVSYRSQRDGVMHACGHDGHIAMLLIAAKILAKQKCEIKGSIKFVFQPCEETMPSGAKALVDEGVLENPDVDAAFGIHLISVLSTGMVSVRAGVMMAAGDKFAIRIIGKGGHGALPHLSVDPVVISSFVIQALQTIASREVDPLDAIVLTVGTIEGGTAYNVIPQEVRLTGTVRALNENLHKEMPDKVERIVKGVCQTYRAQYEIDYDAGVPALANDPDKARLVQSVAATVVSKDCLRDLQSMGYDDMSYFLGKVPGAYYFVGSANKDKGTDCPHHNPRFNIDEDSLPIGVEMHVRTALSFLESCGGGEIN